MNASLLLLGLLRRKEMHGYMLNTFIERDLAICTDLKRSTAYFLLDKMVRQGWVSYQQEQEGGRPPRRVYQITDAGEREFQRLLRDSLSRYEVARFTNDIPLLFLDSLDRDERLARLADQRAALLATLAETRAAPPHHGTMQWVLEHRLRHLEAELAWLDTIIQRVQSGADLSAPD